MIKTQTNFVATSVERANDKTSNHEQSANDRDGQSSASDTGAEALGLVRELAEHLDRRGIHYCHWKSNWRMRAAAQGLGDLDLLVRRSDARCFCEVMSGLGFRLVKDPGAKQLPGVLSFYGVDSSSGSWLHVHAHFQLVMGHDTTKNVHLRIEDAYLDTARRDGLLPTPIAEFEFIVFVLRMVLKYSLLETLIRRGRGSAAVHRELESLSHASEIDRVYALLGRHLPTVDKKLFNACVNSIRPGASSLRRMSTHRKLTRCLEPYSRRRIISEVAFKSWRLVSGAIRHRVLRRPSRGQLASGGAIVAIVGGDGAGKTTSVEHLSAWLSEAVDTRAVHIGKPPRTIALAGIAALRRLMRLGRGTESSSRMEAFLWMLRSWCIARNRYRLYLHARRMASEGAVVICDRFPLPQVRLMEGPNVGQSGAFARDSWLTRRLLDAESAYYRKIAHPDILLVLRLDPEIAVQRKTSEPEDHVRTRSTEIWQIDWTGTGATVIDASQPLDIVLSQLREAVWAEL